MAEKKLKISLDLDSKAFTSAIKRMQDELSKINTGPAVLQQQRQISQKMQQLGLGSLPGAPNDRQVTQSQEKANQQVNKMFEESKRKLDIIKKLQVDLNKEQSSGVKEEERKLKINEKLVELKKQELRATGELATLTARAEMDYQPRKLQGAGKYGSLGNDQKDNFFSFSKRSNLQA